MKKVLWVLGVLTLAAWIAIFLVYFRAALPQHAYHDGRSTNPRPVDLSCDMGVPPTPPDMLINRTAPPTATEWKQYAEEFDGFYDKCHRRR